MKLHNKTIDKMKIERLKSIICIQVLLLLFLVSCNQNNKEVLIFASQIVMDLNNGNADAIKSVYPNAKEIVSFTSGYNIDSIKVEYDRMTNGHKVILKDNVWFVISEKTPSSFIIAKSRGLFPHDEKRMDIAEKTGRIKPSMSDMKIDKALKDTAFFSYLANKTIDKMKKYVYCETRFGNDMKKDDNLKFWVTITVKNETNKKLQGTDYIIKVRTFWMGSVDEELTIKGKDILSNDSISIPVALTYNGSGGTGYESELVFSSDNITPQDIIDRYFDPNINDYKEYLKTKEQ